MRAQPAMRDARAPAAKTELLRAVLARTTGATVGRFMA
jgi:hypothetical protein